MKKKALQILSIFIIGILGGLFANQFIWPYFLERPVYVTERKEITIEENIALRNAVERVEKTIIGIKSTSKEKILIGSAMVLTSDGLIVTLAELVPQGSEFLFFVEGEPSSYQILKRDLTNNLALIKLEQSSLPTVGFADLNKVKTGERIFLVGTIYGVKEFTRGVNEGIVSYFNENLISTNILEKSTMAGSPLFNIKGEFLGLATIDYWGVVSIIPVDVIRDFAGF
ncbi:MAG: trypsin-like peptidase domain-containing protein [Candidatus Nealsonbacteria bacterium]